MTKPSRIAANRAARYEGLNSFRVGADLSGLDALFAQMEGAIEEAVRPASQAAAQVLYDEVKKNVGQLKTVTGNLDRSIYQKFSPEQSTQGKATYHISWNAKTAPHGHLLENGYLQRYRYYKGADGQVRPMVRPGMDGQPRPNRSASQAVKDAYYVTLPVPVQVPAKAFVRRAQSAFDRAYAAAEAELLRRINGSAA